MNDKLYRNKDLIEKNKNDIIIDQIDFNNNYY